MPDIITALSSKRLGGWERAWIALAAVVLVIVLLLADTRRDTSALRGVVCDDVTVVRLDTPQARRLCGAPSRTPRQAVSALLYRVTALETRMAAVESERLQRGPRGRKGRRGRPGRDGADGRGGAAGRAGRAARVDMERLRLIVRSEVAAFCVRGRCVGDRGRPGRDAVSEVSAGTVRRLDGLLTALEARVAAMQSALCRLIPTICRIGR